jgi:HlyD family secretion protein
MTHRRQKTKTEVPTLNKHIYHIAGLAVLLAAMTAFAATNDTGKATATTNAVPSSPQLDAVFEAVEMTPVSIKPKAWGDLSVLEAVPQGTSVKSGDQLVRLDLDKLREQIGDLEQDQPASATSLKIAKAELENLQKTTPYRLDAARRAQRTAMEDLAWFEDTGRPDRLKAAEYKVKSAQQRLDNEAEELKQLEKMYKADDLVEESEEIVLKRQKFAVEFAKYGLETAKHEADWELKTKIARDEEFFKATKRDQDAALTFAEETLPDALKKKQFEVDKLIRDQAKASKRLADLKSDLEILTLRAPVAGVVYYGSPTVGKWANAGAIAPKLAPGGKLAPLEVFMTIVNPDKLTLKATVPETSLGQFKTGMVGTASLVSQPDAKFPVRIEEINTVPLVGGGFEVKLTPTGKLPSPVTPGMNCKVSFEKAAK